MAVMPVPAARADEEKKPVGLTGWKIGLSNSLFVTAPANLTSGGVSWTGANVGWFPSSWSAQNDDVRLEVARATSARFEEVKKAVVAAAGGSGNAGRASLLDGYTGWSYENGDKVAGVWKQGEWVWAVLITQGKAPSSAKVMQDVEGSLWLERVEAPVWKDRTLGMSFQAEIPYEMTLSRTQGDDGTEFYRARWSDFSVETIKGGWKTDFDGTINNHVNSFLKRSDLQDAKVQRFSREFGYLAKERGVAVQIDFKRGEKKYRIYKIGSVTGYGGVITTLTLNPSDPTQLATAARILHTLRLGYGVSGEGYRPVKLEKDGLSFDSRVDFQPPAHTGAVRYYAGQDSRNFVFQTDLIPAVEPTASEMQSLGRLAHETILGNLMKGIAGKVEQATILPAAVGGFPARRVRFEAMIQKERYYGDSIAILTGSELLFPLYLTTTATNDAMPRIASTFQMDVPAPAGWKPSRLGTGNFHAILPEDAKAVTDNDKWRVETVKDGVKFIAEEKRENYIDDPFLSFDGLTTGEKADNPIENDYGALLAVKLRFGMRPPADFHWARTSIGDAGGIAGWGSSDALGYKMRDVIALRTGTHKWVGEIHWNPADNKSAATRDAILASLRCDRSQAATAPPATPATDSSALGWMWLF